MKLSPAQSAMPVMARHGRNVKKSIPKFQGKILMDISFDQCIYEEF